MDKNLYLVRHGETLFNQRGLIQGVVNAPLVLEGVAQALHTKKNYFDAKNIKFDHVFCSPEGRCIQTTELITDQPRVEKVDLHEMCFGKLEGCPSYLCCPAEEFDTYYGTIGGETTKQVQDRMNTCLQEIMADPQNSNVLAVAHGCANQAFADYWKEYGKIDAAGIPTLNNCSVLHFLYHSQTKIFELVDLFNEAFFTEDLEEARKCNQALII